MSLYNVYNLIHVLRDHQNKSVFPDFMLRQLLPRGNAQVFTEAEHHFTRLDTPHGRLAADPLHRSTQQSTTHSSIDESGSRNS